MAQHKHLMAMAAAAAFAGPPAQAQSAASVSGIADGGVYRRDLAGQDPSTQLQSLLSASRLDIRGSEDLGDGLRADFELSSHFRLDTGEPGRHAGDSLTGRFFTRASTVGIRGAWGQLRLGRVYTGSFVQTLQFSPYGDSTSFGPFMMHTFVGGQPMLASHGGSDGVWSNSVLYNSPDLNGFTTQFQYALREGSNDGRRLDLTARYRNGLFAAGLSHSRITDSAYTVVRTPTDPAGAPYVMLEEISSLGSVSWDFKLFKLTGQAAKARLQPRGLPSIALATIGVNAEAPLGTGRLVGGWARTEREQAGVTDRHRVTASFGYIYAFSRRTEWYTVLIHDRATGLQSGTGLASGLKHVF